MKISYLLASLLLISCADLGHRDEKQRIQSQVNQALQKNENKISQCLKEHELFKKFKTSRLKIDVDLKINENGKMEKFTMAQNKDYPSEFVDCLFNVLDQTQFPKLQKGETLELSQPFIFKN